MGVWCSLNTEVGIPWSDIVVPWLMHNSGGSGKWLSTWVCHSLRRPGLTAIVIIWRVNQWTSTFSLSPPTHLSSHFKLKKKLILNIVNLNWLSSMKIMTLIRWYNHIKLQPDCKVPSSFPNTKKSSFHLLESIVSINHFFVEATRAEISVR